MDYKKIIIESYINGYERGHHDTVESVYGNYDEKADEFYEEIESAMCEANSNAVLGDVMVLLQEAVQTDGSHHKQWYLEQIALIMNVNLPEHEEGIAP